MSLFFTSDHHFGHSGIVSTRPFQSVLEMNEELVRRWNRAVCPDDTVYHLGDIVVWGHREGDYDILWRLNGKIHLILGNHDQMTKEGSTSGPKADKFGRQRYESVDKLVTVKYEGRKIVLCHYPLASWDSSCHGSISLYGHCHGSHVPPLGARQMDVGVDCNDFAPVHIDTIFSKFNLP